MIRYTLKGFATNSDGERVMIAESSCHHTYIMKSLDFYTTNGFTNVHLVITMEVV